MDHHIFFEKATETGQDPFHYGTRNQPTVTGIVNYPNMSNTGPKEEGEASSLPQRCIFDENDMKSFVESPTKAELLKFVEAMGKSCASATAREYSYDPEDPLKNLPPAMACLHGALQEMVSWVDQIPPQTQSSVGIRFGNPSFKAWHEKLMERSESIIATILYARDDTELTPEAACQRGRDAAAGEPLPKGDSSVQQVSPYLHDSFGHAIRLDYGTGHESSFLVFLFILSKVKCMGALSMVTLKAVTLSIVHQYLKVTRRLQTDYNLEPAGSHGVWGLDDYHCLPFYFGACQLKGAMGSVSQELTEPSCISSDHILKEYRDTFLYFGCISYIRQLKRGVPFFESSPMLYDISQTVHTWEKVAGGLLRLYQGEVLHKRVVVQHFRFSKLFPCTWKPSRSESDLRAPKETFRKSTFENVAVTRAPWAKPVAGEAGIPVTRAPWAKPVADDTDLTTTRAPWAK